MTQILLNHIIDIKKLKDGLLVFEFANEHDLQDYYLDNPESINASNILEGYKCHAFGILTDDNKYHILSNDKEIEEFNKQYS